jgi:hypothetical protein
MNRFWVWGAAVLAVSVVAVTAAPGQLRSSESLLAKAQSEFEIKARNALIQRHMAHIPAAVATMAPTVVAPLETAGLPVARDTSRNGARVLTAEGLESLRARSPELAAAMAKYM